MTTERPTRGIVRNIRTLTVYQWLGVGFVLAGFGGYLLGRLM
jgi:hypothetical protein